MGRCLDTFLASESCIEIRAIIRICPLIRHTDKHLRLVMTLIALCCTRQSRGPNIDRCMPQRWGPYLQSSQWGINMGKFKLSQISYPVVHCENRSLHTFYYINQGQRSKVKRFSQESAHKQTNGRTDGQTDRRTLPSTLSPSFAVDNDSLSTWVHLIMTLKIGI